MGRLRQFLWSETVHVFYAARIADMPAPAAAADIRPVTPADEPDVLAAFPRATFSRRIAAGDTAFLAFVNGRLAHQSWISTHHAFIPQVEYDRRLAPDEIYFYDCVTLPEFRGRGLYPATLAAAARHFIPTLRTRAVLGILRENAPSTRGATRAGFTPEFEHHFHTCLGLSWSRERPLAPRRTPEGIPEKP